MDKDNVKVTVETNASILTYEMPVAIGKAFCDSHSDYFKSREWKGEDLIEMITKLKCELEQTNKELQELKSKEVKAYIVDRELSDKEKAEFKTN